MATPTDGAPPADRATDDPLSQAMSMLDDVGGASQDFEDFVIDSDDDGNNDGDGALDDVNFDDDFNLDLDDVGITPGNSGRNTDNISGDDGGGGDADGKLISQIDGLRNNLQGADNRTSTTTTTTTPIDGNAPPSHWATKEDVTKLSSGAGGTASVNSTTSTSLDAPKINKGGDVMSHPLAHPLMPTPPPPQNSSNVTPSTNNSIGGDVGGRPVVSGAKGDQASGNIGGWTAQASSAFSMSGIASLASSAAATVQKAVENAEAAVNSNVAGQYKHQHQQNQNQTHQPHPPSVAGGVPNNVAGQVGQGAKQQQQPLSYQERQRLLHQQHAASNSSAGPRPVQKKLTVQQAQAAAAAARAQIQNEQLAKQQQQQLLQRQQQAQQQTQARPVSASPTASRATTPATTPSEPPSPSSSSFTEKLTSSLDTPTKTKLVRSALGELLPGERVIMFLNSLRDVRDSSFGHVFAGSDDLLAKHGLDCLTAAGGGGDDSGHPSLLDGDSEHSSQESGSSKRGVTTVWCAVMTFYRVAAFSYRATLDGKVLLNGDDEVEESGIPQTGRGGNESKGDGVISQWINCQNVSIQFQAANSSPTNSNNSKQYQHHVLQMPLASIERVEKVLASSQKASYTAGVGGSNPPFSTGGSSYYNAILPSSSTVSSTASSAMSTFGSQMKPLLGGMASGGNDSNMLTNGVVGTSSSSNNLALTTNSTIDSGTSSSIPSGPMGIILHGKDGGRFIQFSTSSYTDAQRAHEALNTYAFPGRKNLGYLFAFESRRAEVMASGGCTAPQNPQQQPDSSGADGGSGNPIVTAAQPTRRRFVPLEEYERQGVFQSHGNGLLATTNSSPTSSSKTYSSPWAPIVNANANYGLCSTYPSILVGPRSIVVSDSNSTIGGNAGDHKNATSPTSAITENITLLRRCAAFRSENRFPALTWGNPHDGGSIWRSSQPKVGLQGNRSVEDERYLYAIGEEAKRANLAADARMEGGVGGGVGTATKSAPISFLRMLCGRNNESDLIMEKGGSNSGCMLKIMDMRPKSAAMGNRTQGYGYENTNNYRGTTINFYGIGNIHAVRDAYQKVNALCINPNTSDLQWMQLVENTNWPSMIRLILSASWQTAFHVHFNRLPVLVHCSHGWDRTSQVPALAQLFLDPHYRSREGFSTLIEKDFLSFGHPFHTRCGHGEGKNDQGGGDEGQLAPIFLQFVDCVFQLVNQFPNYFEFNSKYLLLLSEHVYSCRFGTLLCDSEREREVVAGIRHRTYCMWEYLESIPELVNPTYDKTATVLMMPLPMLLRNVTLWTDRYCMYGAKATMPCVPPSCKHSFPPVYNVQPPSEQQMALHSVRNVADGALQKALEDAEMWKDTALAALKEVKELKAGENER